MTEGFLIHSMNCLCTKDETSLECGGMDQSEKEASNQDCRDVGKPAGTDSNQGVCNAPTCQHSPSTKSGKEPILYYPVYTAGRLIKRQKDTPAQK